MSEHVNRTYKVEINKFDNLADAIAYASLLMYARHNDDYVLIESMDEGEDFFEPYSKIVRENGELVLK